MEKKTSPPAADGPLWTEPRLLDHLRSAVRVSPQRPGRRQARSREFFAK